MKKILVVLFVIFFFKSVGCFSSETPKVGADLSGKSIKSSTIDKPISFKKMNELIDKHGEYYGKLLALKHFEKNIPKDSNGKVTLNIRGSSGYHQRIWNEYGFNTKRGEFQDKDSYNQQLKIVSNMLDGEIKKYDKLFVESSPIGKTFTVTVDKIYAGRYSVDEEILSDLSLYFYYEPGSTILFSERFGSNMSCGSLAGCAKYLPPNNTIKENPSHTSYVETSAYIANDKLINRDIVLKNQKDKKGDYLKVYTMKFPANVALAQKIRQNSNNISAKVTFEVLAFTSYKDLTPRAIICPIAVIIN